MSYPGKFFITNVKRQGSIMWEPLDKGYFGGIGILTVDHQVCVSAFVNNLINKFSALSDFVFQDVEVDSVGGKHRKPDISLWRVQERAMYGDSTPCLSEPLMVVEIVHTSSNVSYSARSVLDMLKANPSIQEAFIYNFTKRTWRRYTRSLVSQTEKGYEESSHSSLLNCDLMQFVAYDYTAERQELDVVNGKILL